MGAPPRGKGASRRVGQVHEAVPAAVPTVRREEGGRAARPASVGVARPREAASDRESWAAYVRHVAALPGRAVPHIAPEPAMIEPAAPKSPVLRMPIKATGRFGGEVAVGLAPAGLDKGSWKRLRAGHMMVERTLDLHGRTAQHAHAALLRFLMQAQAERLRVVEVITGRGSGEGGGVIRRELPLWLNLPQVRPMVLAVTHPHAANTGSVRILLRKTR